MTAKKPISGLKITSKAVAVVYKMTFTNRTGKKKWMQTAQLFFPSKKEGTAEYQANEFIHTKRTFDDYKDFEVHFLAGGRTVKTSLKVATLKAL